MLTDDATAKAAEAIIMRANAAFYAYGSNGDMTPEAIRQRVAQAWVQAQDDLTTLQDQTDGDAAARKVQLQRQVFGTTGLAGDPASLAMSARDASERVAQIDPTDWYSAQQLLDRAEATGDEVLARAVAAAAFANPFGTWDQVLDSFLATRPSAAQALGELSALNGPSLTRSLATAMQFILPIPPPLAGLQEWQIRTLAAQASA